MKLPFTYWKAGLSPFPLYLRQRDFRGKSAIKTIPSSAAAKHKSPTATTSNFACSQTGSWDTSLPAAAGAEQVSGRGRAAPPAAGTAPREPLGAGLAAGRRRVCRPGWRRGGGTWRARRGSLLIAGRAAAAGAALGPGPRREGPASPLASRGGGGGGGGGREEGGGGGGGSAAAFPSVVAARLREKRRMSRAVLAWLVLCGSLTAPRLARGERRGRVGSRLSRSRSPSARGPGAGRGRLRRGFSLSAVYR